MVGTIRGARAFRGHTSVGQVVTPLRYFKRMRTNRRQSVCIQARTYLLNKQRSRLTTSLFATQQARVLAISLLAHFDRRISTKNRR